MSFVDLESFKTKKCDKNHPEHSLGSSFFNCCGYHSREDKRRNPFVNNRTSLAYSQLYVEDYYSTQMASSLIEYLYHPNIYKTIPCSNRFNKNYEQGLKAQQCTNQWCPYIHTGDNLNDIQQFRGLPLVAPIQDKYCQKIQQCSHLNSILKGNISDLNIQQQINNLKTQLKGILTAQQQKQQQKIQIISIVPSIPKESQPKPQSKQLQKQNWYVQYNYFHYAQKIPMIQDRNHQFKNYRDIVNNNIAPIVMKYVAAFLNSDGGVLYVGIDDSSVVYGLQMTQHEFDRFLLNLDGEGKRSILPPLLPHKYSVRRIPVYGNKKGKQLWVVEIKITPSQKDKKNRVLSTYNRQAYIRMNASTQKLDAINLIQYIRYGQEQKQEHRGGIQILQELQKTLQRKQRPLTSQELGELKQRLGRASQRIQELLNGQKKQGSESRLQGPSKI